MSTILSAYLVLERLSVDLDKKNPETAEKMRAELCPIWEKLTEADRAYLNTRKFSPSESGGSK